MNDTIRITFSAADQTGQAVVNHAQALYQTLDRLQFATNTLLNTGLQGSFLDELDARCREIQNQLRFVGDETSETGHDLLTVSEWFRQLDAECAAMFSTSGGFYGTPSKNFLQLLGGLVGNSGEGSYAIRDVDIGDYPTFGTRMPFTQTDVLRMYLGGQLAAWEADILMKLVSKDRVLPNFIDVKANILEKTLFDISDPSHKIDFAKGENYGLEMNTMYIDENGVPHFSYDVEGKASLSYSDREFEAGVDVSAAIYAARVHGSAEMNGFHAAGDAYVGATASVDAGVTLNPFNGEAKVVAKAEAFVGVEAKGSVGYENEFFSVDLQGSVSYGVGAKGVFEAGMEDGIVTFDAGFLLSPLGTGAGAGLKVQVNVLKVGEAAADVVEDALQGASALFDNIF